MVFRGMNVKSFARTQKCLEFANIPTVATCKLLITLITIYHTKKKIHVHAKIVSKFILLMLFYSMKKGGMC